MRLFTPGLEFQVASYVTKGRFVLSARLMIAPQPGQRFRRHSLQPLPLEERPLLERGAVGQKKLLQKASPVERNRCLTALRTSLAAFRPAMDVRLAQIQQGRELAHVEPHVGRRMKLDALACDNQKGWL